MSLLTRLWLAALSAMLLALIGTFSLSIFTARDYLRQQLYAQGSDSAAALALSMSQESTDPATAQLLVSALFDSGHFDAVRYLDTEGKTVVERVNTDPTPGAPAWFVRLFPMRAQTGQALVTDGWKQAGKVEVTATSRFAHASLWTSTLRLGGLILLLALLLGSIMNLLVRWAKRPLAHMVGQAQAIGEGRFVTAPVSAVPELRAVSHAMNSMVERVAAMFSSQAARIEQLRDAANRDELTGLPNRTYFIGRLREALDEEAAAQHGVLLLMRINDLGGLNRRLGRAAADQLVRSLADELRSHLSAHPEGLLARLNGADFGLLLPGLPVADAEPLIARLEAYCFDPRQSQAADAYPVAFVGGTTYRHGQLPGEVLARTDGALMKAELGRGVFVRESEQTPVRALAYSAHEWRGLIDQALAQRRFSLVKYPVLNVDGGLLHQEVMLRMHVEGEGAPLTAAQFLPAAIRLGRGAETDLMAVELALQEIARGAQAIAVNISAVSVQQSAFVERLAQTLRGAGTHTRQLWLEVGEGRLSEAHGSADLAHLASVLVPFGCRLGIDQFGRHFAALPRLYAVKINYLKIDAGFIADIQHNAGNQRFIKAMVDAANGLAIAVYAERVSSEAEWQALCELGVAGMTGPAATARARLN